MEISNALLVAIMFVTLLSLGIIAILSSFATSIVRGSTTSEDTFQTIWRALLLLAHFTMFWHTTDLLSAEEWSFLGFLFIVAGPVLIFFATSVLLEIVPKSEDEKLRESNASLTQRFFFLVAVVQAWIISTDYYLGHGFTGATALNAAAMIVVGVLAFASGPALRNGGTVVVALIFVISIALKVAGVIP